MTSLFIYSFYIKVFQTPDESGKIGLFMGQHNILTGGTGGFTGPPAKIAVLVE
jgi:hypothetical protein